MAYAKRRLGALSGWESLLPFHLLTCLSLRQRFYPLRRLFPRNRLDDLPTPRILVPATPLFQCFVLLVKFQQRGTKCDIERCDTSARCRA